ncbi:unnamed protein product, partial [Choristocarpus tenellus]
DVPLIHCASFRKLVVKAGVSLASLWDLCKHEKVKKDKQWIKPVLSDQQKVNRMGFIISHTHRRVRSGAFMKDLYDWMHVNEMWFYILKDGQDVYLHPTENPPNPPRAKNKSFIIKVIFVAAV